MAESCAESVSGAVWRTKIYARCITDSSSHARTDGARHKMSPHNRDSTISRHPRRGAKRANSLAAKAFRGLLKHRHRLERLRQWLTKHKEEPVPPCPRCGSPEGCYADCPVAPWNLEP